ncbi:MAG TPA: alpha/beta hydrolase [Deinococcales bacterium]|nr:alpha/beta hydrolase [Deinococcales bacterium]
MSDPPSVEMSIERVEVGRETGGYLPVRVVTSRGVVECRHYPAPASRLGAVFVGGAGGGWDTPARGRLYPDLCESLPAGGIHALRVRYRQANALAECALDVLAGLHYLEGEGVTAAALTGHSFGGAVVVQTGAASRTVRTVVALSTQTYGIDPIGTLGPRCSVLLAHGTRDRILPARCSLQAHAMAREPKRLKLLEGADHGLDEAAHEVTALVRDWIGGELTKAQ